MQRRTHIDFVHMGMGHSRSKCGALGTIDFEIFRVNHHQLQCTRPKNDPLYTLAQAKACAERKLAFGEMALASRSEDLIQTGISWTSRHV